MAIRRINGKAVLMAEIRRQSNPKPNKLVMRMPRQTCNWKKNPRVPSKEGMAISPELTDSNNYFCCQPFDSFMIFGVICNYQQMMEQQLKIFHPLNHQ